MTRSARRNLLIAAAAGALALAAPTGGALGGTAISIARTADASVFSIPAYIAMEKGLFAAEGLDAHFVVMTEKAMVTAGLQGAVDFVPNSAGGARAALKGGRLLFVVGGATVSQWAIMVERRIAKPDDLRGRILGRGHPGSPGYGEGAQVLHDFFGLRLARHYQDKRFPSESQRLDALLGGSVQGALLSFPLAARAGAKGFRVLLRTGAYLPGLDGAYWSARATLTKKRAAAAGFIRAIAKAIEFLRDDRDGAAEVIRRAFKFRGRQEAEFLRDLVNDGFSADLAAAPLHALFEGQRQALIAAKSWPKDRKLPNVERFVARNLLTGTLRGMGYRLARPPDLKPPPR